jgi:nitrogen fixation protein FixH
VEPDPPAGAKDNMVHVGIQDGSGKTVNDAQVHLTFTMPAMPEMKMPEMKNGADLTWNGTDYSATVPITMAGSWNVEVEAKRGGETLTKYETKLTAK